MIRIIFTIVYFVWKSNAENEFCGDRFEIKVFELNRGKNCTLKPLKSSVVARTYDCASTCLYKNNCWMMSLHQLVNKKMGCSLFNETSCEGHLVDTKENVVIYRIHVAECRNRVTKKPKTTTTNQPTTTQTTTTPKTTTTTAKQPTTTPTVTTQLSTETFKQTTTHSVTSTTTPPTTKTATVELTALPTNPTAPTTVGCDGVRVTGIPITNATIVASPASHEYYPCTKLGTPCGTDGDDTHAYIQIQFDALQYVNKIILTPGNASMTNIRVGYLQQNKTTNFTTLENLAGCTEVDVEKDYVIALKIEGGEAWSTSTGLYQLLFNRIDVSGRATTTTTPAAICLNVTQPIGTEITGISKFHGKPAHEQPSIYTDPCTMGGPCGTGVQKNACIYILLNSIQYVRRLVVTPESVPMTNIWIWVQYGYGYDGEWTLIKSLDKTACEVNEITIERRAIAFLVKGGHGWNTPNGQRLLFKSIWVYSD